MSAHTAQFRDMAFDEHRLAVVDAQNRVVVALSKIHSELATEFLVKSARVDGLSEVVDMFLKFVYIGKPAVDAVFKRFLYLVPGV